MSTMCKEYLDESANFAFYRDISGEKNSSEIGIIKLLIGFMEEKRKFHRIRYYRRR